LAGPGRFHQVGDTAIRNSGLEPQGAMEVGIQLDGSPSGRAHPSSLPL
jgi:hypothetical protein